MIVCRWILKGPGLFSVLNKLFCCTQVLGVVPGTDAEAKCTVMGHLTGALGRRAGFYLCFINKSLHIFSPLPFLIHSMSCDSVLQCLHRPCENQLRFAWENQLGLPHSSTEESKSHFSVGFFRANLPTCNNCLLIYIPSYLFAYRDAKYHWWQEVCTWIIISSIYEFSL